MSSPKPIKPPDSPTLHLKAPKMPMNAIVNNTIQGRRVTYADLSFNVAVTLVGIALIVLAVLVWVHTVHEFGWVKAKIPIFAVMGGVALIGIATAVISLKRFVEGCYKWKEFQKNASILT